MRTDVERLRGDLDTIEAAMGAGLPFTWKDVGLALLVVPAGAATAALAWGLPAEAVRWAVVPIVLAALPTVAIAMRKKSADGVEAARRREWRFSWISSLVLVLVTIAYFEWERRRGVSPRGVAGGACMFFCGVALALVALTSRGKRPYWGAVPPLMVFGLLIPGATVREIAMYAGIACAVSGLLTAGIQTWQLRMQERA